MLNQLQCLWTLYIRHLQIVANEKNRHDPLTGLFNRNRFVDLAETTVYQHKKWQINLSLMVINIDNFREFNYKYGCDAGDELLRLIAKTLQQYTIKEQHIARIGADEFALILPKLTGIQAKAIAEKIIAENEHYAQQLNLQSNSIHLSIGISDAELSEYSLKNLLSDGSKALRKAKASTTDKIYCFDKSMTDRDKYKIKDNGLKYFFE